jgi:hypothetical protein
MILVCGASILVYQVLETHLPPFWSGFLVEKTMVIAETTVVG